MSEDYDGDPTIYTYVPTAVIKTVVIRHGGLRTDRRELLTLTTEEERESKAEEEEEERDEDGCL